MKYVYRIYQLLIGLPIFLVTTIITAVVVIIGCMVGSGHFWGYYPGRIWSWIVKGTSREEVPHRRSIVSGNYSVPEDEYKLLLSDHQIADTYRRELAKYQQQIERLADIREWGIWLL